MSRLQTLLDRLPSHFANAPESNNYKLLSIVADNSYENRTVYETIQKFWDVDTAKGVALDRLGKEEGISRGGWNDEEYRKMIKIQNIVNLSEGDTPTMNLILDAYIEEGFIGLQDGWADFEPASLLLNITNQVTDVPTDLIRRIKPAGVRVYVLLNELIEKMIISGDSYAWPVAGPITSRFKTGSRPAAIPKKRLSQKENIYAFTMGGRISGRFRAGGAL